MGSSHSPFWTDRSLPRLDRQDPYLSLHFIIIFVRDQERSLRFYLDQLGFRLVVDHRFESGDRWIEVAPPDGSANLALVPAKPNSEEYKLIGRESQIFFLTEDVTAKFNEWSKRGVRFHHPPQEPAWGGIFTRFEDVDGNSFGLAGFDEVRRGVEAQRRALAEKLESEHRVAQEMEIAKQVQARLFPQKLPSLRTLEFAGACVPARQVGGDYYDFFELRLGRVALLLADIAGKGVAAALLMANLQANLRSQYGTLAAVKEFFPLALEDFEHLLVSVNRLFYESSGDSSYATLFFVDYDDTSRRLCYANCGHLPALLLRNRHFRGPNDDGFVVEHLGSTSTVMGLFDRWECRLAQVQLAPGDILIIYTDGVTEAVNADGEEFGENHLLEIAAAHWTCPQK
jgi:catechol 2,3-dioxygenase-like lactoylglutathione lyase family enzyme